MNFSKLRARPWGTALTFFAVGVFFASAMDWTPFSHAQGASNSRAVALSSPKGLEETSNAFTAIAERITPAVVTVQTRINEHTVQRNRGRGGQGGQLPPGNGNVDPRQLPPQLRQFFDGPQEVPAQEGTGSGFIVSPDGYIVTNNHVVADADNITVLMTNHHSYSAKLIGRDEQTDVAVIKIDAKNLPTVQLGDDERTKIGEWVLAFGNPLGLDFTVTAGIVSAKGRDANDVQLNQKATGITDFIQTDAAINPGNSGGPLVNIRGEVIGINTAIASRTGYYTGYGFAIPIDLARTVWEDLIAHGHIIRAQLGINIKPITAEDAEAAGLKDVAGVMVAGCGSDSTHSAGCNAGLENGDVIFSLDGKPVDRMSALQRVVRMKKPGDFVAVKLMRFGKEYDYRVKLSEMEAEPDAVVASAARANKETGSAFGKLGFSAQPVSDQFAKDASLPDRYRGLLQVASVDPTGNAHDKLFENNDIILGVMPGHTPIKTAADLKRILGSKHPGDVVSLEVLRTTLDDNEHAQQQAVIVNVRVGS